MRTLKSNALRRKFHSSTGQPHVRLRLLNCVGLCLWREGVWILKCVRLLWLRPNILLIKVGSSSIHGRTGQA